MPEKDEPKDKRISVLLEDEELARDVQEIAEKLRSSKGGLGALALEFVIPRIKSGELASLNSKLVPAKKGVPLAA